MHEASHKPMQTCDLLKETIYTVCFGYAMAYGINCQKPVTESVKKPFTLKPNKDIRVHESMSFKLKFMKRLFLCFAGKV